MATSKTARVVSLALALFLFASSIVAVVLVLMSGSNDTPQDEVIDLIQQQQAEQAEKENNVQQSLGKLENFTPSSEPVTQIQSTDLVVGTGAEVSASSTIKFHYTGAYVVTGDVFQTSVGGEPVEYALSELIPGWQQGLPGMKAGGKRRLVIPGSLAYGEAPEGYTPGSSDRPLGPLVFDIEVLDSKQ